MAVAAPAAAAELLPEGAFHLRVARYLPEEPRLEWDAWIGAGFGLLRARDTTLFLRADVETVFRNEGISFQVEQADYQIDAGAHRPWRGGDLSLFVHHVSRHLADQPKSDKVDWNLLGAGYARRVRVSFPLFLAGSLAFAVDTAVVDYRVELTAQADAEPLARPWGGCYLLADLRVMLTDPDAPPSRSGFADFRLEGGARFPRGVRALEAFLAYEHREDVLVAEPGARDRALLGFRVRSLAGGQPSDPPGASARGPWRSK